MARLSLVVAVVSAFLLLPGATQGQVVDPTSPSITGLSVSPTVVDVTSGPQTVTFTATITAPSGVFVGCITRFGCTRIFLRTPSFTSGQGGLLGIFQRLTGDQFTASVTIPQSAEGGLWRPRDLFLIPNAGVARFVSNAELQAAGIDVTVQVNSNRQPDCSGVTPTPGVLWPPNHKLRLVSLGGAADPDGDPVTLTITAVTQDEPAGGGGNTSPDVSAGPRSNEVFLRAERSGGGDGRVYRISFTGSDDNGGSCSGTVAVSVPRNMGAGSTR